MEGFPGGRGRLGPPVAVECAERPHAERHEGPPLERRPIAVIVTSASYLLEG
jgi:hypothetical protein